jgi:hypothetical protein
VELHVSYRPGQNKDAGVVGGAVERRHEKAGRILAVAERRTPKNLSVDEGDGDPPAARGWVIGIWSREVIRVASEILYEEDGFEMREWNRHPRFVWTIGIVAKVQ